MPTPCPFCEPDAARLFHEDELVLGLWDAFPVTSGHALLVPRRHVATWFDASPRERQALTDSIEIARAVIEQRHKPDGFNIGINIGQAAGQTVFHLHVHVIPRYRGDVPDPRGGVRHVIAGKGNYLLGPGAAFPGHEPVEKPLVTGGQADPLLRQLVRELAEAERADVAVAFALPAGVECLGPHFADLLNRGGRLRLLTGDYRDVTDPDALLALLDLPGDRQFRVFECGSDATGEPCGRAFHPKAYILKRKDGSGVAFVGSSNLSESALLRGVEWNYRVVSSRDLAGWSAIETAFDALWTDPATRPLTREWTEAYRARRLPVAVASKPMEVAPEPLPPATPHAVQREALKALEETRAAGRQAGLVVLATGLGKTWLAAFDSNSKEFKRVLFVAHREEILAQARATFRRVRPSALLGYYHGDAKDPGAEVLFASIQTLGRKRHLDNFPPGDFDYIVVDEFHHAAAATYRRLLDHFRPKFLLGLTATPERSDGGDLLALCQDNLVYRCNLAEGIRRQLLCPFSYFGVPDAVDYDAIPWKSRRFDEEKLTEAVATHARAANALEQWQKHAGPGSRTLAFCVSQRHADFMAKFFTEQGLRAVAVHSGPTSAPRALSLEQLASRDLDIVCAVDMFNEGVDVPTLDAILMLRPTESRVVWLQQFGRGLRVAEGKRLRVVDYIGNHRVFLVKPQTLFDLPAGRQNVFNCLEKWEAGDWPLPPGCEVTYQLEALEILRELSRWGDGKPPVAAVREYYEDFKTAHEGARPTASEAYFDHYNPRSLRPHYGSWFGFVDSTKDLSEDSSPAFHAHRTFLESLETTEMVKSYKMLVVLAMIRAEAFPGTIGIDELGIHVRNIARGSDKLVAELGEAWRDDRKMSQLLERNPIQAWVGGRGTGARSYFDYKDRVFGTTFRATKSHRAPLRELTRELAQWRLDEYLCRSGVVTAGETEFVCAVSQAGGRPMLFLPDRTRQQGLPRGWTPVAIDGEEMQANFVKVALNVVRLGSSAANELPAILRRWFGPHAGKPGTRHRVIVASTGGTWVMQPLRTTRE